MKKLLNWTWLHVLSVVAFIALAVPEVKSQTSSGTVGDLAESLGEQLGSIGRLAVAGGAVIGIVMIATGLLKLKAAAGSQGEQVKYSEGIWRVAVGASLLAIPAFTGLLQTTLGLDTGASLTEGGGQSF